MLWQHNVRPIALGLEALRAVNRYGVTKSGEQYVGWKAIRSGSPTTASSRDEALALVVLAWPDEPDGQAEITQAILDGDADLLRRTIRRAKAAAHPDRNIDPKLWDRVQQAIEILGP